MTEELKQDIVDFQLRRISKEELFSKLPFSMENKSIEVRTIILDIIDSQISDDVELGLALLWLLEEDDEFIDLVHKLILEPWHTRYEDIIHDLQRRKNPLSIPVIKIAIQKKYEYLESYGTGTGQFISQCGYALFSIGTQEAHQTIEELSKSTDDMIKYEMEYQLKRIHKEADREDTSKTKRWWTI